MVPQATSLPLCHLDLAKGRLLPLSWARLAAGSYTWHDRLGAQGLRRSRCRFLDAYLDANQPTAAEMPRLPPSSSAHLTLALLALYLSLRCCMCYRGELMSVYDM